MGTSVPIFAVPPVPCLRGPLLRSSAKFPARKIRVTSAIPPGPLGPGCSKIAVDAIPQPRLVLPSRWRLVQIPAGGPMASPTQSRKSFLRTVGEGLAPPVVSWDYFRIHRRGGYQPPEPSPLEGKGAEQSEADEGGLRNGTPSAGRPVSAPCEKEGKASVTAVGAARQSLPPSRGKVARPKVVTDEGDFLACTPPGGSPKGLPCRESERCAQGAMSSTARLPRAVLGLVPSKEKTP